MTRGSNRGRAAAAKRRRPASRGGSRGGIVRWIRDATWRQWLRRLAVAVAGGLLLLVVLLVLAYSSVSLPPEPEQAQTSLVLDADGNQLAELYKDENRVDVRLDEVATVMREAVLAAEDRNFHRHSGLDPVGITRALVNDLRGRELQGGSTITQQLVKNTYLTSERSLTRKLREAVLAVKVERQLSKDEILERYLNTIYFGRGAYGIEKAAERYFGRRAAELELHQAALLAGLIRAPESADPSSRPEAALRRREIVLDAMVRNQFIDEATANTARDQPLGTATRPDPNAALAGPNAYFVSQVRRWAVRQFGERVAFGGGLRIESTLRPAMQAAAEDAVRGILDRPDDPEAALVALDDNGGVVAMIGGRDFEQSNVNLAVNNVRPQAGSTFKPFVLAAALDAGIPAGQRYAGPARLEVPFEGHPPYEVRNYGNESYGEIDLIDATAKSVNTVYAQLASEVGLEKIVDTAHRLGVSTELDPFPAMSLGSEQVSPLEMIRAYMTFATRGGRVDAHYVSRVTRADGTLLYQADPRRRDVYPEDFADVMNHVLAQGVARGTGRAADIGRPVAGKTGTTSDNTDAWFVGYTPRIGAAVWMGYTPGTERKMTDVHGRAVTGGSFPAQIWQRFMRAATEGMDTGEFTPPNAELLRGPPAPPPPPAEEGPAQEETEETEETTTTTEPEPTTSSTSTTDPTTTTSSSTTSTTAPRSTTTTTTEVSTSTTTTTAARGNGGGPSG